MFSLRHFLTAAGLSTAACAVIALFPRCENPRELAIGDWRGSNSPLQVQVSQDCVLWHASRTHGKFSYTWIQDKDSPYRVSFRRGETVVEADVHFDGDNAIIVEPIVFDKLPPDLQQHLRRRNKALGRPETEIKLSFIRLKQGT